MPKIAVVGGSLAGLTAANLLRDAGCDVHVYERSPRPLSGFGTGIVVQPELVRYLVTRGGLPLERISVGSSSMRYLDAASEAELGQVEADWRFTSYNTLYDGLLTLWGRERYYLGKSLVGINDGQGGATLRFADGEVVECDLAVGADGGWSVVRQRLLGLTPEYAGYVTWRGVVEREDLSRATWEFFDDSFTYGLLPDGHVIAYPIPALDEDTGRRMNFQWYWNVPAGAELEELMCDCDGFRRPVSVHFDSLQACQLEAWHDRVRSQLSPRFAELLGAAREPFVTTVADRDVPRMAFDSTVLIGDAAVTPRPHAAAGGAKACADGWALADALVRHQGDVRAALESWEPDQLALGRGYLAKVRRMADALQHGGSFPPGAAEYRFGLPTVAAVSAATC